MKLLAKYNRINIPVTVSVLLISGIAYYLVLHFVLLHQLSHDLEIEEQEIRDHVADNNSLPQASTYRDQHISFDTLLAKVPPRSFTTVIIYDEDEKEEEYFRQLTFPIEVNGKTYQAIVRKSQAGADYLIRIIAFSTLSMIIFLLAVLFVINRFILRKLWQPFNTTLEQMKQFNISSKNRLQLRNTPIEEFEELNKTAMLMTEKVSSDYESLKSFTENASHEIQTPLAIIKMKTELLMQSENMNATQMDCIGAVAEATDRLSRLNQSLLLLTKIDNSQFINSENVNISNLVTGFVQRFEELAATKNIVINTDIEPGIILTMNRALSETMISNLITNTIKHNLQDGHIDIFLDRHVLSVSNTGKEPTVNTYELFERFKKDSTSPDSLGLGLAIVKKICETYHFTISYNYIKPIHSIQVAFNASGL